MRMLSHRQVRAVFIVKGQETAGSRQFPDSGELVFDDSTYSVTGWLGTRATRSCMGTQVEVAESAHRGCSTTKLSGIITSEGK